MSVDPLNAKIEIVAGLPAFAGLPAEQHAEVAQNMDLVTMADGDVIMRQGHIGHEFFIIVDGTARVERDGKVIARVSAGDVLGELALIGNGHRNATVVAESSMTLLSSMRAYFASLVVAYPEFGRQVRQTSAVRLDISA